MRILVTGASGLLGKSLCPLLDEEGWQYWACNSKIFDIYYNLNNHILQQHNYSYCSHFIENQSQIVFCLTKAV